MSEETAQQPEKKPVKSRGGRPSHSSAIKTLKQENAALKSKMDELGAMLKALAESELARAQASGVEVSDPAQILEIVRDQIGEDGRPRYRPLEGPERVALDEVDPLAFIDEDTREVFLVGRVGALPLRQSFTSSSGLRIPKKNLPAVGQPRPWFSCPYEFLGPTARDTEGRQLQNRDWWHFRMTIYDAEEAWLGRMALPRKTIIVPSDLDRVTNGMIYGKEQKASGLPLREITRYMLLIHGQVLFFDTDIYCPFYAGDTAGKGEPVPHTHPRFGDRPFINPFEPNPYFKGCLMASGNEVASPFRGMGYRVNADLSGHDSAKAVERITAEMVRAR